MGRGETKKRGKEVKSPKPKTSLKLNRLDLLKKKLELEQQMLEEGKSPHGKEIDKLEKELEETEDEEDTKSSAKARKDEEEGSKVEKALANGRKKESDESEEPADVNTKEKEKDDTIEKVEDIIKRSQQKAEAQTVAPSNTINKKTFEKRIKEYQKIFTALREEVGKLVVGQTEAVTGMIRALIADGHVLVEGVPGTAKTTLIRTLAKTTACSFSRIQFTPDLLPTDIVGISTYQEGRGFYTLKGPIFNNFILADEINRAPPKVQSALLECMAEKQATIAKESFPVPLPFFTMATQNPLESVGTYALPEAQVDRFLFKIYMGYPSIDEEQGVLKSNISSNSFESYNVKPILNPDLILQIQTDARQIYVDKKVERYVVTIIDATRFPKKYGINTGKYVEFGASPRGSIGLFNAARADALLNGQTYVTPHNVKTIAYDVLRHRIILSYEGQAEGIKSEQVIEEILKKVPVP